MNKNNWEQTSGKLLEFTGSNWTNSKALQPEQWIRQQQQQDWSGSGDNDLFADLPPIGLWKKRSPGGRDDAHSAGHIWIPPSRVYILKKKLSTFSRAGHATWLSFQANRIVDYRYCITFIFVEATKPCYFSYLQYACHWSSTTLSHCHCREAKTMSRAQLWHLVSFCFERKLHGSYSFAIILENIFYNFSTINFFSNSPFFVVSALLGYAVSYNQVILEISSSCSLN